MENCGKIRLHDTHYVIKEVQKEAHVPPPPPPPADNVKVSLRLCHSKNIDRKIYDGNVTTTAMNAMQFKTYE